MTTMTYHVTLNMPEEYRDYLDTIKNNYLTIIKASKYPYAVAKETTKKSIFHYHIAYDAPDVNSTSNETRKYRNCYEQFFTKKEFPNAIKHTKHDDRKHLLGYLQKENLEEFSYSKDKMEEAKRDFVTKKSTRNTSIWTVNNSVNAFVDYIRSDETHYRRLFTDNYDIIGTTKRMFKEFARKHPNKLQYSVYAKYNFEKLYEYLDIVITLDNYTKK